MDSFKYRPISKTTREIRLLRILPKTANANLSRFLSPIECELFHVNFDFKIEGEPVYKALSYTWGDQSAPKYPIHINGGEMWVFENLWHALRRLRLPSEEVILWIDAICIDQSNTQERNQQITLMASIYYKAETVIVWLGEVEHDTHLAFELVNEIYDNQTSKSRIKMLFQHPDIGDKLEALKNLFQRPYWSRIWIVQELSYARTIVIRCGHYSIGVKKFGKVQSILSGDPFNTTSFIWKFFPLEHASKYVLEKLGVQEFLDWRNVHSNTPDLSLYDCLKHHEHRKSTDPRDMVFGLAGLPRNSGIKVDYSLTVAQVYTNFSTLQIEATHSLEIIVSPLKPTQHLGLPSWVRDWSNSTSKHNLFTPSYFQASSKKKCSCLIHGNILRTDAIKLPTPEHAIASQVTNAENKKQAALAFYRWWNAFLESHGDAKVSPHEFMTTISCDRISRSAHPKDDWEKLLGVFGILVKQFCPNTVIDPELARFMDIYNVRFPVSNSRAREEYEAWVVDCSFCFWDRFFFIGTPKNPHSMGLLPCAPRNGDLICILLGCQVPFLLRPIALSDGSDIDGSQASRSSRFKLLGTVYYEGYMQGEAIELLEEGKLEICTVEIE